MTATAHRFSVAPMMDWTDRHCRAFHRVLSRRALLYTEMVTADAVIHGDRDRLIGFNPVEHPVALQLGGADPRKLAEAAQVGVEFGYNEINLNCGCPSDRVQSGAFGACLMRESRLVADCVAAMADSAKRPVTIKCRIGVDDDDPRERLFGFVQEVANAGCKVFIVHARKAWLKGLSPKENREIPPLDYSLVADLKRQWPDLTIVLNGGLVSLDQARMELEWADGVMLGRAAYQSPDLLRSVDSELFGEPSPVSSMTEAIRLHRNYVDDRLSEGVPLHAMTRHLLGAFSGRPGARSWRRILSTDGPKPGAGLDVLDKALAAVTMSNPADQPDRSVRV